MVVFGRPIGGIIYYDADVHPGFQSPKYPLWENYVGLVLDLNCPIVMFMNGLVGSNCISQIKVCP